MTANKKATMQQLVLLTGFSEYALTGAGKNQLPPYTMSFPCIAFRSGDAKLTYPNGQNGHEMRLGHGDTLPESLFTWTGVAKDVVTVPDDAKLEDCAGCVPGTGTAPWADEIVAEMGKRIEQFLGAREEVEDQWILNQVGEWATVQDDKRSISFDGETPFAMVGDVFSDIETPQNIAKLLSAAPELYAALKSARELLSRIYLEDKFDYNHVALEIMNANAALAKAVGKGVEDYVGALPDDNGDDAPWSDEVLAENFKRAERVLGDLLADHPKRKKRSAKAVGKG